MELIVQDRYDEMKTYFYLKYRRDNQTIIIGYNGKTLVEQIPSYDGTVKTFIPLLIVPNIYKDAIIKAFISEGANQNLRTENENLLKGKLQATELHLSDMREFSKNIRCKLHVNISFKRLK